MIPLRKQVIQSHHSSTESVYEQPGAKIFKYDHPNTSFSLQVVVTGAGPQCPGCGETKVQLVKHMKTDKRCSEGFGKVDFASFDAQLKRFRSNIAVKHCQRHNGPMG